MGETTKTGAAPGVGVGETIKQRDYMFDTFRGLLMWSIPISHFTRVAGHFSQASLGGVVYITINVFVMQAFVFLSGYFSKKPDRSKETSFHTFMWPYLLGIPFFVMAFYCTSDQIKKLQCLKKWQCWALGTVLLGISCLLAFCVPQLPVGFYLLKNPACELGITWYWDIIGRALILFLAWGWIIFMLNILPNKKNYLAYVGMNTMPIYIFHLIVRYAIKFNGIGLGIVPVNNWVVYYGMIFGLASLCAIVFSTKPVVKIYDFVVEGTWKLFCWLIARGVDLLGLIHKPVMAIKDWTLRTIGGR